MKLEKEIEFLKKRIGKEVREKLKEFEKNYFKSKKEKFLELCFCILVANTSAESTNKIWKKIKKGFITLPEHELRIKLKSIGYRFYNKRASYIVEARKFIDEVDAIVKSENEFEARELLVKKIKGIGWKEASHFLRNLGFKNFAILDRHVLKILEKYGMKVSLPLTKKKYLEIEEKLRNIAKNCGISLAELDFYLFYLDTGKICER